MKSFRVMVFINDSTGELDWIQPFLLWAVERDYEFYVYFYLPGKSEEQKKALFESYFGDLDGIRYLNETVVFSGYYSTLDRYLNSLLRRLSGVSYRTFLLARDAVDGIRKVIGGLVGRKLCMLDVDLLMRDYNLKDSIVLAALESKLSSPKVCIFPHSTAIQSNSLNTPKKAPKRIKCDLFLENTDLSTLYSTYYKDSFLAVGSPSFDKFDEARNEIANYHKKSFLFITRNCDERFFGINYQDSGEIFEDSIRWARDNNYRVYVKHHPRDARLSFWREIQSKYDNVVETTTTLNHFDVEISFVLCLYTSAGLLFTKRDVPVFDVSPYKGDVNKLPFHYVSHNGFITHELVDYGFYGQYDSLKNLLKVIDPEFLENAAKNQKAILRKYFPSDSCRNIDRALHKVLGIT